MDEIEQEDTTLDGEESETVNTEESVEELKARLEIETTKNAKLFERAKKAEGFTKQSDGTWLKKPEVKIQTVNEPELSEELKLIARGLSDEEIEQAKVISRGKGVTLAESLKDPMFISFQKDLKETERKEKAKIGASKGSGQQDTNDIRAGMTREEHEAAWRKANGK